jgi:putative peptidoglycan lipid II flippase
MKKTAIVLMIITILIKIFGFFREMVLSYFYGASYISDAYIVALTIPGSIFAFIGVGITTGYIPIYSSVEKEKGTQSAAIFTSNLINFIIIICAIITIIVFTFAEGFVKLFASGFTDEVFLLAVSFTRICIFEIFFVSIVYILSGYLNLKGKFFVPALISLPFNFIIISSIVLSHKINISILPIGNVIAVVFQILFLIPFVYKVGYRHSLKLDGSDKWLRKLGLLTLPVILGVSVNQINILVDKTMASQILVGGISALNYASKLNGFIQGIFITSIATVLYPNISKLATEGNMNGLKQSVAEAISGINLLIIPATIGAMVFSEPIVRLLFDRGAFDNQAVSSTSSALYFYSIGMLGYGLREILSRVFYSLHDTKTPMINAAIAMIMNIVLNIILSRFLGIGGLALATSISAIFCTVLLFISLKKKITEFYMKNLYVSFIKILIASLIMGLIARISYNILINIISMNLSLILSIGIGAFVYSFLVYIMKIEEVHILINIIKRRLLKSSL